VPDGDAITKNRSAGPYVPHKKHFHRQSTLGSDVIRRKLADARRQGAIELIQLETCWQAWPRRYKQCRPPFGALTTFSGGGRPLQNDITASRRFISPGRAWEPECLASEGRYQDGNTQTRNFAKNRQLWRDKIGL
jgi:hypothetical protein